jgi:urea carboxylase-associated protein 2
MSNIPPLYEEILPPGGMWSMRLRRGHRLSLTTQAAGANVSALFYNAEMPLDRLNVPDTLKALHTAKIHRGHVLMTDMGRAVASLVEDSLGWHDPLGGLIDAALVEEKFGRRTYQEARNDFYRNGRDNFLVELSKYGLGEPDLVANVNFFSKVVADEEGRLSFIPGHAPAGTSLTLRADLDAIAILANVPHPMHPPGAYPAAPVQLTLHPGSPAGATDFCRQFRPECDRALQLSERYFL